MPAEDAPHARADAAEPSDAAALDAGTDALSEAGSDDDAAAPDTSPDAAALPSIIGSWCDRSSGSYLEVARDRSVRTWSPSGARFGAWWDLGPSELRVVWTAWLGPDNDGGLLDGSEEEVWRYRREGTRLTVDGRGYEACSGPQDALPGDRQDAGAERGVP